MKTAAPETLGFDADKLGRISDWMQSYVDQRRFAGASVLVARGGVEAYYHNTGLRSTTDKLPFERSTLARIYSMTKPITSVALMMLAERGLFHLDAPVSDFVPAFRDMQALIPGAERIDQTAPCATPTLHQLLTHTSGLSYPFNPGVLPRAMEAEDLLFKPNQGPLEAMVTRVAALPLSFPAGTRWEYSVSIDILGRVIEIVSGKSLAAFFADEIFGPLGMYNTAFSVPAAAADRFASLYTPLAGSSFALNDAKSGGDTLRLADDATGSPFLNATMYSGGGGLVGTIDDYMRFVEMLRQGGSLGDVRLLSPHTTSFMMRNHLPGDIASMGPQSFAEQPMDGMGFGLGGAVVLDPARARCVGSVGDFSWGGMASTFFWFDPVLDLSVVFFTQLSPSSSYPARPQFKGADPRGIDAMTKILWTPSMKRAEASTMADFMRWLDHTRGLTFSDYNALWRWSTEDLDAFWAAIWDYFQIRASKPYTRILGNRDMPGAEWCPGAMVNYSDQMLARADTLGDQAAVIVRSETFGRRQLSWTELRNQVASVASHLRKMGVGQGDRVVAILPNTETALIAFLATASLGAIWSICAPDMGHVAILDRFQQIEPKVLIAQDAYVHAGKMIDRAYTVTGIIENLPTVDHVIKVPVTADTPQGQTNWADLTGDTVAFDPVQVPFDHPLWIVYSSGTTGNPKPIVHGHGGVMLEMSKQSLHHDLTTSDRFCWLTSSGWIMWNAQWMALGQGATVAMFDGAPNHPDMSVVWQFMADECITFFGAGAAFFTGCMKANQTPRDTVDLTHLRSLGSTGSPLSSDAYDWIYTDVKQDVWLAPISGGTDLAGAFVLGHPMMPVRAGEMQCRALGNAVHAFDEDGNDLTDQVGELVCTAPLPSMPLYFWGDTDGSRLHESYFDTYPGVWRHGDWIEINADGNSVIYGRSDATINRKGLRMGSAEIYQAVEGLDEILDSLVVDLEFLGRDSFMPLFVVPKPNVTLDDALKDKINAAIRRGVSARFIPNEIVQIAEVPRTLSGKKLEVPVKKLLLGGDPAKVVNRDSMANPDSFDTFIAYATARKS